MPRKKPTTKLGVYGKCDISPENAVELYTESKAQDKINIKQPYWDIAREGLELSSIKNEKQYVEMTKLQEKLRENCKINEKLNEKRIQDLYKIQNELREKFIHVNDFIRDCEEKESNAEKKMKIESDRQNAIKIEINKITNDLKILTDFHEKLKRTVNEFSVYKEIIDKIVDESELYRNPKDLIVRCDALMLAQVEIAAMEQKNIKSIEEMRQNMVNAANEAALSVMGLHNELAELERIYNNARSECLKLEKILANTQDCIIDQESQTFRLLDQIQQIYHLFCRRNNEEPVFQRNDIEQQLDYIKEEMETLQAIIKNSKQIMEEAKKSDLAQQGSVSKIKLKK